MTFTGNCTQSDGVHASAERTDDRPCHLALLAAGYGTSEDDLAKQAAPVVAHLVERGLLRPAPG
jgi:hypothetical protein